MRKAVVFFADRTILPGLHAALVSLGQSNTDIGANLFIFSDGLSAAEEDQLAKTWARVAPQKPLMIRQFSPDPLANKLHGNSTAYGRLYLGDLLPDYSQCVYLDCDIIVNTSLSDLFATIPVELMFAADCTASRESSPDRSLFVDHGVSLDGNCFNSGVLAINLDRWRSGDALARCRKIAKMFPGRFRSADQSLMNVALHDQVKPFGSRFNTRLRATNAAPLALDECIYHFVGSPKPWDLFGYRLHKSHKVWHQFFRQSVIGESSTLSYLSLRRLVRTSKQLFKVARKRLTQ
jgi:lipopolysaccharide biosynthesis glycosyltransferase